MSTKIEKIDLYAPISFGGGGGNGGAGGWDQPLGRSNTRPSKIAQCVGRGVVAGLTTAAFTSETGPGAVVAGSLAGGITTMSCLGWSALN